MLPGTLGPACMVESADDEGDDEVGRVSGCQVSLSRQRVLRRRYKLDSQPNPAKAYTIRIRVSSSIYMSAMRILDLSYNPPEKIDTLVLGSKPQQKSRPVAAECDSPRSCRNLCYHAGANNASSRRQNFGTSLSSTHRANNR